MNWYRNAHNATKLMLGFGVVVFLMAVVGYMGISGMGQINTMLTTMYDLDYVGTVAVKDLNNAVTTVGRELRAILVATTADTRQVAASNVQEQFAVIDAQLTTMDSTFLTEKGKAAIARVRQQLPEYRSSVMNVSRLGVAGNTAQAVQELDKMRPIITALLQATAAASETKTARAKDAYANSAALYASTRRNLVILIALAVLAAIGIGFYIARLTSRPLEQAVSVLKSTADGDLTKRLELDTKDEIGQMSVALNQALDSMQNALLDVQQSADTVTAAAQELASSSEELAGGAQEQASSHEETSATLEELAGTVKQNAENARQANQLASGAREAAENGGNVVGSAVQAMNEINTSSKRIADIITTIDEIAFQTNLLALNAAVEAARAGEQGRGFAVVAAEVRNLAQRSATSAKEIKTLIQDSVRKVENGSDLVNRSGQALNEIVASVKRVTDIVGEIAAASQEQSTGIDQIAKAMAQMDQVTQQNSTQTEELTSVAQNLSSNADELQALVARFKVESGTSRRRKPATAPAKASAAASRPTVSAPRSSTSLARLSSAVGASEAAQARETEGAFTEF